MPSAMVSESSLQKLPSRGMLSGMTNIEATGKLVYQDHSTHLQSSCRIFIRGSNANIDLSNYGDPADGVPITLWTKLSGENQVWRLEQV